MSENIICNFTGYFFLISALVRLRLILTVLDASLRSIYIILESELNFEMAGSHVFG